MPRVKPFATLLISLVSLPAYAQATSIPLADQDQQALTAATQGLCLAEVAMLDENSTHGDGHTLAFKAALV